MSRSWFSRCFLALLLLAVPSLVQAQVASSLPVPGLGAYTYDGAGNVTAVGDHSFFFDAFGRLKKASLGPGKSHEYTYDRYGNIVEIATDGDTANALKLAVDPRTNRLDGSALVATRADATYDAGGNAIATELGDVFVYDGVNMAKEWTVGATRKVHLYTASDERLATITLVDGVQQRTDWTLRDATGKVLRRLSSTPSGSWTWEEDYIYRDGRLLAAEVPGPAKTLHFHLDHLGTPRLITGNGGAQIARHTYYPFGKELTSLTQDTEALKFTGHERDGVALDYMHARYYTPEWGRFLSVDPKLDLARALGSPQEWNRYSYVHNNPINFVDPDGRAGQIPIAVAVLDKAADVAGLAFDLYTISQTGLSWKTGGTLVLDVVMTATPVPGNLGAVKLAARNAPEGSTLARAGVYISRVENAVNYVGITNNMTRRAAEHAATKGIKITSLKGLESLSRSDARAVEQALIETHKLLKDGGTLMNKINSIAKTNPRYAEALERGYVLLNDAGYVVK
jgi:RHS repeat-associated protein